MSYRVVSSCLPVVSSRFVSFLSVVTSLARGLLVPSLAHLVSLSRRFVLVGVALCPCFSRSSRRSRAGCLYPLSFVYSPSVVASFVFGLFVSSHCSSCFCQSSFRYPWGYVVPFSLSLSRSSRRSRVGYLHLLSFVSSPSVVASFVFGFAVPSLARLVSLSRRFVLVGIILCPYLSFFFGLFCALLRSLSFSLSLLAILLNCALVVWPSFV